MRHPNSPLLCSTIWLLLVFFVQTLPSLAQSPRPTPTPKRFDIAAWQREKWTGNELKFRRLRASIERDLKAGIKPEVLMRRYDKPQKFRDPVLVFGYSPLAF